MARVKKSRKKIREKKSPTHGTNLIILLYNKILLQKQKIAGRKIFYVILLFALLSVVIVSAGGYFTIKTHEEFAANFADDTLRPLIGNQATIALEASFFNAEDLVNQTKYKLFSKKVPALSKQDLSQSKKDQSTETN